MRLAGLVDAVYAAAAETKANGKALCDGPAAAAAAANGLLTNTEFTRILSIDFHLPHCLCLPALSIGGHVDPVLLYPTHLFGAESSSLTCRTYVFR